MKRFPLLASLPATLLVAGLLAGCGNGSSSSAADQPTSAASSSSSSDAGGPPTNASVQAFCQTFIDMITQANSQQGTMSDKETVKLAKTLAAKLEQVGTPADMPAAARRAFETAIAKIKAIPDDATKDEMSKAAGDLTAAEKADQSALSDYITQTCMGQLTQSASPSAG